MLSTIWNLRAQAFETSDRSLMAEFETGPALESDEVTCGCNTRAVRGPIIGESLFVPRQRNYPATFLAEVTTTLTDAPYVQYLIISRQSEATPWEVVADPGESVSRRLDQPKTGRGGFDDAVSSNDAEKKLPRELASYWHTWTEGDHEPRHSPFAAGKWTSQAGSSYAKDPSGSWSTQNGLQGYYSFEGGGNHEGWSFATSTGAITCGVVRWQTIWTYPGGGIYQDPSQDNWGASVAPGSYQYEAETQIMQPCFIQRPGARIEVVSGLGDPDTEQGDRPASCRARVTVDTLVAFGSCAANRSSVRRLDHGQVPPIAPVDSWIACYPAALASTPWPPFIGPGLLSGPDQIDLGTPSITQETAFRFTDGTECDAAAGCLATGRRVLNAVPAVDDLPAGGPPRSIRRPFRDGDDPHTQGDPFAADDIRSASSVGATFGARRIREPSQSGSLFGNSRCRVAGQLLGCCRRRPRLGEIEHARARGQPCEKGRIVMVDAGLNDFLADHPSTTRSASSGAAAWAPSTSRSSFGCSGELPSRCWRDL